MRHHAGVDRLIEALRDPACYPFPAGSVEVVETHISWVLLAGDYAYKIKKPVRLAFLDFSTLAARRRFCEEELRLNRRTAPDLYLEVVPITCRDDGTPVVGGDGETVEYALRMRRFPADALAERMARAGMLGPAQIDAIGAAIAAFHAGAPRAGAADGYGTAEQVVSPALGNFDQIAEIAGAAGEAAALARLRAWTAGEGARLAASFAARLAAGFVRECHGDLHLGNIAFLDGRAVPFDCIEFDPALRWIDVASEVAFLVMDLRAHGLPDAGWRLLNDWLQATGDYACAGVLRFYLVYRAMVRAKIACLRGATDDFRSYVALAGALAAERRPALILMHGLSGSGKTTLSQALLEALGALRLRSDVERKRLHGIDDPLARTGALIEGGIYSAAAGERTYGRLAELARACLAEGWPVIVDAAALRRAERERFRVLAREAGAPFALVACNASREMLLRRVAERAARGSDASDADAAVLQRQLERIETPGVDEAGDLVQVDTNSEAGLREGTARILARLAAAAGAT
jgi:hypothetical protein